MFPVCAPPPAKVTAGQSAPAGTGKAISPGHLAGCAVCQAAPDSAKKHDWPRPGPGSGWWYPGPGLPSDLARTRTRPVPALSAPPAARVAVSSPRAASREGPRPPWAATAGPHLKTGITGARSSRTVLHPPEAGLLPARILLHPARCEIGSGPSAPRRSYGESHAPGSPAASSQLGVLVILERRLLAASFTMGHL